MTTDADKYRREAKEHVQLALEHLTSIVVSKCDGHDGYCEEYETKLKQAFFKLIEVRDFL